jgi:hypothetical protein
MGDQTSRNAALARKAPARSSLTASRPRLLRNEHKEDTAMTLASYGALMSVRRGSASPALVGALIVLSAQPCTAQLGDRIRINGYSSFEFERSLSAPCTYSFPSSPSAREHSSSEYRRVPDGTAPSVTYTSRQ